MSDPEFVPPPGPPPASIAHGPALIGTVINVFLYGIMTTQTYIYFTTFKRDRGWMKAFVAMIYLADTVNTVFDIVWIYSILINEFGNFAALQTGNWVFSTDPAMVGIIATMCQCFFAWRIHVLLSNWLVTLFIVAMALCSAVGGVGVAIYIRFIPQFVEFQKFSVLVIVWLIAASCADIAITIVLTWHIRRKRFQVSDNAVDDVINRILRMTVQNGLITAVAAVVDLIAYLATPTGLHLAFNFPLAKLYTNTLMSSLNARSVALTSSAGISTGSARPHPSTLRRQEILAMQSGNQHAPEVFVNVETVHDTHELHDMPKRPGEGEWSYSDRSGDISKA